MSTKEPRETRNKRIALEALGLLDRAVSEDGLRVREWLRHELEALRDRWERRGATWVRPSQLPLDLDEWLTANDMAKRADVKPDTVRRWHYRGYITSEKGSDGQLYYNVGEVVRYQAKRNQIGKNQTPI